ncbi:hypothetical protein [Acetatifactor aquisgranensis]|uniref:hypothetical protein n=1 Tax=Acetatifactor aquisgranensis TaxID=2941233 RepID=UPI00203BFC59|nr:hypothetical protein [Acetatifactor aquisgranensis]
MIKIRAEPILLDFYMDMVEKQDEIIYRLGKIVARQATDLKLLQNDQAFTDKKLEEDMAIVREVMEQYKETSAELEP